MTPFTAIASADRARTGPSWPAAGTQFLPVRGYLTDRLLVTYRVDAAHLATLVPAPCTLDVHQGYGFLSVCVVEIADMCIGGVPRWLGFDNREFLYRIGVRTHGEPGFITLRSDVSSPLLAVLGRAFSHYRPRLARVSLHRQAGRLAFGCSGRDPDAHAQVEVDTRAPGPHASVFANEAAASAFLLGMNQSVDVVGGRVRVQPIEHGPWQPRFVHARHARFAYLDALGKQLGASFEYDSTLAVQGVAQVWQAARWR